MRSFFLTSLLYLFAFCVSGQGFRFYKENITMKIEKDYFHVTGIYYLKSDGNKSEVLVYPYPVDSLYGTVDSICIYSMTSNTIIKPNKTDRDKTVFTLGFGHNPDQDIQISYRQKLLGNRAEYILKSTIGWREPLDQANYQLIVQSGMLITRFSIPPQDSIVTGQERVYLWKKHDYMPSENLIFDFIIN
jgi:hypothetical protein